MAQVWTYWECSACESINRGDVRVCPNCNNPIPNNTKYLMPDNPKVINALKHNAIKIKYQTQTDEKGIVSEEVSLNDERKHPNWKCRFCGYQNFDESDFCSGCGSPRNRSDNYFSVKVNTEQEYNTEQESNSITDESSNPYNKPFEESYTQGVQEEQKTRDLRTRVIKFFSTIKAPLFFCVIGVLLVSFLVWLFVPVEKTSEITSVEWSRTITVEEYKEFHESDWSLPSGAKLERKSSELHHYDHVIDHYETKTRQLSRQVLDHYETKTKQVAKQVLDGYDTSYRDLGNGQAEVVKTPRYRTEYVTETYKEPVYKTEYYTETYEEPVYKDVPIYKTKYYYEIGRWKYVYPLITSGKDKNPYWFDTTIPNTVNNPNYGDKRLNERKENYYITVKTSKGKEKKLEYSFEEWDKYNVGDLITYKSFRFSE